MKIIITVAAKELKDILRDRKTLIISILMPLILFPLVFSTMNRTPGKSGPDQKAIYSVTIHDPGGALTVFLKKQKGLKLIETADIEGYLLSGKAHIAILPLKPDKKKMPGITIIYDNSRQASIEAFVYLKSLVKFYINPEKNRKSLTRLQEKTLHEKSIGAGRYTLALLLPLLLIIFSAASPLPVAADMGAGEKERGTIEALLCSPPARGKLLSGKLIAITIMGIIGVTAFMTGLGISLYLTPEFFSPEHIKISISAGSVLYLLLITLLLSILFGAGELALSLYARSIREAQVYFVPLIIITMACAYASIFIDPATAPTFYAHMPLVNTALIIKKICLDQFTKTEALIQTVWLITYICSVFKICAFLIHREAVLNRS